MQEKEFISKIIYDINSGEEIARIRVKLKNYKSQLLWETIQLEGVILGKWLPIIRYDFDPKERLVVHKHKEYISTLHKELFTSPPAELIERAKIELFYLTNNQIKELIKKREGVFRKEGK